MNDSPKEPPSLPLVTLVLLLLLLSLRAAGCVSLPLKLCATGERLDPQVGCICMPDHVPDADGKGCHIEAPPTTTTTTTTTTSTTTTTTTTLPPRPVPTPTIPPPAPTPTPTCIPDPPMPAGPVDVRNGLAPSSCERPSENMKCFKERGDVADYPPGITDCWNYQQLAAYNLNAGHWRQECRGGLCLLCDEPPRGCFDKFGRRYGNDDWTRECYGSDCRQPPYPWSGQYGGICPPRAPTTCASTDATCSLPAMPECGSIGNVDPDIGLFGCCVTEKHPGFRRTSPFDAVVDEVQLAEEREGTVPRDRDGRVDEAAYTAELVRRLRAKGLCATVGGPGDELGLKQSNGESFQYDVHFGNGRPRRGGYVAYCRPARF